MAKKSSINSVLSYRFLYSGIYLSSMKIPLILNRFDFLVMRARAYGFTISKSCVDYIRLAIGIFIVGEDIFVCRDKSGIS